MATLEAVGLDELMLSMTEIAEIPDSVQDAMLNAQADIVVNAQKSSAVAYGVRKTGITLGAIKKGNVKNTKSGKTIYVYPRGTNADGNRNGEVAFINEYGKKNQTARPFIKDANEKSASATTAAAMKIYDAWLKSKNL